MGKQPGNLRAQLIHDGICADFETTKLWIRENCSVQFVVVEDNQLRRWAEYFMLAILRPLYCD